MPLSLSLSHRLMPLSAPSPLSLTTHPLNLTQTFSAVTPLSLTLSTLTHHSPSHSHTDPLHCHASHSPSPLSLITHPLTQTLSTVMPLSLTLSTLTQSPLSSTLSSSLRCDFLLLNPLLKYIFGCFSYCVINLIWFDFVFVFVFVVVVVVAVSCYLDG